MAYYKCFFGDTFLKVEAESEVEANKQATEDLIKLLQESLDKGIDSFTSWEISEEEFKP